jgi:4-amino-4-deoxychorismate lyase
LDKIIDPYALQHEDVKCRFIYDASTYSLDYEIYKRRVIKKLKVINDDHILYPIKKFQRPELDRLFSLKEDTDEIIIVKKGLVTDAFYYNLVFEDHNGFYTPQACLLKGTMRQRLLDKNKISIKKIAIHDLAKYHRIHLINALNGLGSIVVETSDVIL